MLIAVRTRHLGENVALFESDRLDVSMATSVALYPNSKLITDNLDDYAMAWGQRRSQTTIKTTGIFDEDIKFVSLLGINREMPTFAPGFVGDVLPNQARLVIDLANFNSQNPQVQSSDFSLTNLTGVYSTLNQVINPPEQVLPEGYAPSFLEKISDMSDTTVQFTLGNFASRPLNPGADLQEFLVHVRDSVDVELYPALIVTLRQSGLDVATLSSIDAEKTSEGYIIRYLWNASLLPSLTSPVQVRLHGDTTGTSTTEYMAFVWNASITGVLFDTGWQDVEDSKKLVWCPDVVIPEGEIWEVSITIELSDFSYKTTSGGPGSIFNSLGDPFHAGRFAVGKVINAPLRSQQSVGGFNLRKWGNNANSLVSSYGGQFRAIRSDMTRWQADLTFIPQSQSRMFGELSRFMDDVGYVLPALYIPNDGLTDPYAQHPHALWAIITSFEAPDLGLLHGNDTSTSAPHTEDKRFDLRMSIIEAHAHSTKRTD